MNLSKKTEEAVRWLAGEYHYLEQLYEEAQAIEEKDLSQQEKNLRKALRVVRYIGKAERRADRNIQKILQELHQYPDREAVRQAILSIEIPEKKLIEESSLYLGHLRDTLKTITLDVAMEKKSQNEALALKIKKEVNSLKVEIKDIEQWLTSLLGVLKAVEEQGWETILEKKKEVAEEALAEWVERRIFPLSASQEKFVRTVDRELIPIGLLHQGRNYVFLVKYQGKYTVLKYPSREREISALTKLQGIEGVVRLLKVYRNWLGKKRGILLEYIDGASLQLIKFGKEEIRKILEERTRFRWLIKIERGQFLASHFNGTSYVPVPFSQTPPLLRKQLQQLFEQDSKYGCIQYSGKEGPGGRKDPWSVFSFPWRIRVEKNRFLFYRVLAEKKQETFLRAEIMAAPLNEKIVEYAALPKKLRRYFDRQVEYDNSLSFNEEESTIHGGKDILKKLHQDNLFNHVRPDLFPWENKKGVIFLQGKEIISEQEVYLQLSRIINQIHARKVVGIDLRATNVLLSKAGKVYLVDFDMNYQGKLFELGGLFEFITTPGFRRTTSKELSNCDREDLEDLFKYQKSTRSLLYYSLFQSPDSGGEVTFRGLD